MPDNKHIIYASTHLVDDNCPEVPLRKNGKYIWPVYDSFDIFVADLEGNIVQQLTNEKGYDAEPTVSPKGDKIVFTPESIRNRDSCLTQQISMPRCDPKLHALVRDPMPHAPP